jgi:hypothetical protein
VFLTSDRDQQILAGLSAQTRARLDLANIKAPRRRNYGGLDNLKHNKVIELRGAEPDFLGEFRTRLGQSRWSKADTVCFYPSHFTVVIEIVTGFYGSHYGSPGSYSRV